MDTFTILKTGSCTKLAIVLAIVLAFMPTIAASAGIHLAMANQLTVFQAIDRMEESGEISWDRALLYRCQAYRMRSKLPRELAALPYPEQFVCPLDLFLKARKEMDRCHPEIRSLLLGIIERPESIGHLQSAIAPIRVHYETISQIPRAEEFLGHVEQFYRYFVDVGGFYDTPPDDGRGGSDDFDVYIIEDGYAGVMPEDDWKGSWWSDLRSYTWSQPDDIPHVISTLAHELNHSHQLAMNWGSAKCFYEATATIMEDYAYPEGNWINGWLSDDFQQQPHRSIDWYEGPAMPYQYAAFMFPKFLVEYYNDNQIDMVGEIWQEMVQEGLEGEPDYLDAIDTVIARYGPETFNEMFRIFTNWRWFTGYHNDGQHYDEADEYASILPEAYHAADNFPLNGKRVNRPPSEYGSSFVRFIGGSAAPGGPSTCTLHVDCDPDKTWSVKLMIFPAGGGDPAYELLEVDEEGFGSHVISGWSSVDSLAMSTINFGDGDHDPEAEDWDPSHYRYAAVANAEKVPSIVAGPGPGPDNPALIRGFHANGQPNPYGEFETYPDQGWGTNIACGDPDGDGIDEILTGGGPGPSVLPEVKLFEATGQEFPIFAFPAYGTSGYGVNVAFGDLDGDGRDEILTGPASTFGPHVRAFRYLGGGRVDAVTGTSFLAYGTTRYGVNVAGGDVTGDGRTEIVTGPGPGPVYGPQVRVFNPEGIPLFNSFFAYGTHRWGVNVCCGDIDGDGIDEIVTGAGPGNVFGPHVRAFEFDGSTSFVPIPEVSYFAYGTLRYGVNVTCGDIDDDGIDEIVTGPGPSVLFGAHVRGWNYDGTVLASIPGCSFFAFSPSEYTYGVKVAVGKFWE